MAGVEHLLFLRQEVEIWNQWSKKTPAVKPYLREAVLRRMELNGANCMRQILERPICLGRSWLEQTSGAQTCLGPAWPAPI